MHVLVVNRVMKRRRKKGEKMSDHVSSKGLIPVTAPGVWRSIGGPFGWGCESGQGAQGGVRAATLTSETVHLI